MSTKSITILCMNTYFAITLFKTNERITNLKKDILNILYMNAYKEGF